MSTVTPAPVTAPDPPRVSAPPPDAPWAAICAIADVIRARRAQAAHVSRICAAGAPDWHRKCRMPRCGCRCHR